MDVAQGENEERSKSYINTVSEHQSFRRSATP